jgi:hypothetical protein
MTRESGGELTAEQLCNREEEEQTAGSSRLQLRSAAGCARRLRAMPLTAQRSSIRQLSLSSISRVAIGEEFAAMDPDADEDEGECEQTAGESCPKQNKAKADRRLPAFPPQPDDLCESALVSCQPVTGQLPPRSSYCPMLTRRRSSTGLPEARIECESEDEKEARCRLEPGSAAEEAEADDAVANEVDAAVINIRIPVSVPSPVVDSVDLTEPAELSSASSPSPCSSSMWSAAAPLCLLHLLPCHIRANGPAAVSRFFHPQQVINPMLLLSGEAAAPPSPSASASSPSSSSYIPAALPSATSYLTQPVGAPPSSPAAASAVASSCWYIGAFRGREMTGEKLRLPAGCIGLVLRSGREAQTSWRLQARFYSLFLWHRDQDWRGNDRSLLRQTMKDWPTIAAALHG